MNQRAQPMNMRALMPKTAEYVDRMRREWGAPHVDRCLRRGVVDQVPGFFYAMEGGQFAGTPFEAGSEIADWQAKAVLCGATYAVFMATPEGLKDGKD